MPELHPTIVESDGKPAFVVLPFAEYEALLKVAADAAWDAAFEETTPEDVARIDARIDASRGSNTPLFDAAGKFSPPVPA